MDKATIYNDRNVYILGAGFSKEVGLPVVNEFLNRMRDCREWLQQQSRKAEVDAIDNLFRFRLAASSVAERICVNLENIEDLFSLAAASSGERFSENVILAIGATLDYAEKVAANPTEGITVVMPGWQTPNTWKLEFAPTGSTPARYTCPLMEKFMLILFGLQEDRKDGRRDTIITLNYDTLPEDALYNLRIPFTYGIPTGTRGPAEASFDDSARCWRPPNLEQMIEAIKKGSSLESRIDERAIRVLKLHGSVNWTTTAEEDEKVVIHGTYEDVRNKKTPLLVPPTWRKALGGSLLVIWDAAVAALREATNVVIIGYSMPPTDQHFKYLLAAGLQGNISLRQILFVNPRAAELESSLFQVLRTDLRPQIIKIPPRHQSRASDFIKENCSLIGRGLGSRFGM